MSDEHEFVESLKRKRVIVTAGSTFGSRGKNHVRISYATSLANLKHAFDIMKGIVRGD